MDRTKKIKEESYNYLDMTKGHLIKQYLFHIEIFMAEPFLNIVDKISL